jgi:PhnB protein
MAPSTTPKPIPDTYPRVTPCLIVQGGAEALDFYTEVFGGTERVRFPGPGGTVAHAEIQIGDSVVIVEDESPERGIKAPPPGAVAGSPSFLFITIVGDNGEAPRRWGSLNRRLVPADGSCLENS